jgi:hypothetical protein
MCQRVKCARVIAAGLMGVEGMRIAGLAGCGS